MTLSEFDIINKFFSFHSDSNVEAGIRLSVGDDAAVVCVPERNDLALCIDTLVAGVHFPQTTHPFDIAYKAVAVNLSDLAAMGAEPKWITLALTLEKNDADWLQAFSAGLQHCCNQYSVKLIGGDVSRGALTVTVQAHGWLPKGKALTRSGAKPHDKIYVTGHLGEAAFALYCLQNAFEIPKMDLDRVVLALNRPTPCVQQGIVLRDLANSCIDISDGLVADLGHILEKSNVGATLYSEKIPLSPLVSHYLNPKKALEMAITGGDDYQLCFTLTPENEKILETQSAVFSDGFNCIGEITKSNHFQILDPQGKAIHIKATGYNHFS